MVLTRRRTYCVFPFQPDAESLLSHRSLRRWGLRPGQRQRQLTLNLTASSFPVLRINGAEQELRLLLEGRSFGSCLPVHLRGAGKVAEIRVTSTTPYLWTV
jgi:hypothetical protein